MSENLPVLVQRVGGELAKVVSDIESYTSPEYPLDRKGQMALARMVEDHADLNTEPRIAVLVDVLAFHGVKQSAEFIQLFKDAENDAELDLETVYLALDYLYEVGERGHDDDTEALIGANVRRFDPMKRIMRVIELIQRLRESGIEVSSVETLSDCTYRVGGFNEAIGIKEGDELPEESDDDTDERDEVRSY